MVNSGEMGLDLMRLNINKSWVYLKTKGVKLEGFKLEWEPPFNSPCEGVS